MARSGPTARGAETDEQKSVRWKRETEEVAALRVAQVLEHDRLDALHDAEHEHEFAGKMLSEFLESDECRRWTKEPLAECLRNCLRRHNAKVWRYRQFYRLVEKHPDDWNGFTEKEVWSIWYKFELWLWQPGEIAAVATKPFNEFLREENYRSAELLDRYGITVECWAGVGLFAEAFPEHFREPTENERRVNRRLVRQLWERYSQHHLPTPEYAPYTGPRLRPLGGRQTPRRSF